MMPLLLGVHTVWSRLDDLQRAQNARPRRSGLSPYASDSVPTTGPLDPGARLRCVRTALWLSKDRACGMLAERLSGINLSAILGVLVAACEDVAVVWGGSVLVGGALGGAIGAFGGGVGAVPGATLGAGLGVQAGAWILGFLGLKSLIEDLGTAVPEVLRLYEQSFRTAWGKADDWDAHDGDDFFRTQDAARQFAEGHVLLMVTMLGALLAYLTRGRGDPAAKARVLQEIRESPRLGPKVADWVAANEEALARHPGLKPKEHRVMMSQARPPAEPPMTPSQLRKAMGRGEEELPPPKKPEPPAQPKVMAQKKVRCFEPNGLPKAKIPEFERQLAGQERGLNDMTVGEYLKGRDAFDASNRDPQIAKQARAEYEQDLTRKLREQFIKQGLPPGEAAKQAAQQASAKMGTLAALHNPDMIAAGKDTISDFGDRNVNSRIGAQWKSRAGDLDAAAKQVAPAERATTKMNARLERC